MQQHAYAAAHMRGEEASFIHAQLYIGTDVRQASYISRRVQHDTADHD